MRCLVPVLAWIAAALALPASLHAGDWPQILGPGRNGQAVGEKIAASFPSGGPKTLWQRPVGSGLAGVAVAGGRLVLFHRVAGEEVIEALDAATGKNLWKHAYPSRYVSTIAPDDGPRCVPVIHQQHVYLFGAEGRLTCLKLADGKELWSRNVLHDYDAPEGYFGAGSSPLVEGDKLLVNVGGPEEAGLVAFSLITGETIWKATNEGASYSSPVAATIDGVRHVIFVTRLNAVSVDPANGQVRFRFPFGMRGPTVNGANPLVLGRHLFLSASYGIGARLAKIERGQAQVVWEGDDVMSSQYATCVEHDGTLYGIDGRQDVGVARLRAFDPLTRQVHWTQDGFGMATLIAAGDKLIAMKTDGELVLIDPSPRGYRELATARLFDATTRALPALSNGRLFVRDSATLKCIDLSAD